MNKEWEMVRDFQRKFHQPVGERPTALEKDRVRIRYAWLSEELEEFRCAEDMTEQADAMIDLMYYALGALVEMGIKPDEIFRIVHEANMRKEHDGTAAYDENGKVMKPADWTAPYDRMSRALSAPHETEADT